MARRLFPLAAVLVLILSASAAAAADQADQTDRVEQTGKHRRSSAPGWNDGAIAGLTPDAYTVSCVDGGELTLINAQVGWFGEPGVSPRVDEVYYARVVWAIVGDPYCAGGAWVAPEVFLPRRTQLAIDAEHPVRCFAGDAGDEELADFSDDLACPQEPIDGMRGGLGFWRVDADEPAWWTPVGTVYAIAFPVVSTAPLPVIAYDWGCDSCLSAAVWAIDGVNDPWVYPFVGVWVPEADRDR